MAQDVATKAVGLVWGLVERYGWRVVFLLVGTSVLSGYLSKLFRADLLSAHGLPTPSRWGGAKAREAQTQREAAMRKAMAAARERQQMEAEEVLREAREKERAAAQAEAEARAANAAAKATGRPKTTPTSKPAPKPSAPPSGYSHMAPAPSRPTFRPARRNPSRGG